MDVKELARLVNEMRRAQDEFYRTRSDTALERAKQLERRVDAAVRDTLAQPTLF